MAGDTLALVRGETRHRFNSPYPFEQTGPGAPLAVTTTSARVALPSLRGEQALITNYGATACFIEFGGSTVTAINGQSLCILPTTQILVTIPLLGTDDQASRASFIAAITAASTTSLQISVGWGC